MLEGRERKEKRNGREEKLDAQACSGRKIYIFNPKCIIFRQSLRPCAAHAAYRVEEAAAQAEPRNKRKSPVGQQNNFILC